MGYDIYNRAGGYHRLNIHAMARVRRVLVLGGVPAGNLVENAGQQIEPQECRRIAEALRGADADQIAVAVETCEPDPFELAMESLFASLGEEAGEPVRVICPTPDNDELVECCREFADFCESSAAIGGMTVH